MENITVILVDDEAAALNSLEIELKDAFPDLNILAKYQDPIAAVTAVKSLKPDLIFLDIGMPEMDGFEFLQQFDNHEFEVIFVTAYDEYAIRAFEFNAVAYLLKPILEDKLIQAVEKAITNRGRNAIDQKLEALLNHVHVHQDTSVHTIALPIGDGFEFVRFDDINYVQADNNYCWVILRDGQRHLISKTLKELESMISRTYFFRVHKSYLINLNHVHQYLKTEGGQLLMIGNHIIPIARRKKDELKRALGI